MHTHTHEVFAGLIQNGAHHLEIRFAGGGEVSGAHYLDLACPRVG